MHPPPHMTCMYPPPHMTSANLEAPRYNVLLMCCLCVPNVTLEAPRRRWTWASRKRLRCRKRLLMCSLCVPNVFLMWPRRRWTWASRKRQRCRKRSLSLDASVISRTTKWKTFSRCVCVCVCVCVFVCVCV
jgi:hypothetical protein